MWNHGLLTRLAMKSATQTSNLFVTLQKYNGDPFAGHSQVSSDIEISTPGEADVTVVATPEPAAWLLMGSALLMFAGWASRPLKIVAGGPVGSPRFASASGKVHGLSSCGLALGRRRELLEHIGYGVVELLVVLLRLARKNIGSLSAPNQLLRIAVENIHG